MWGNGNFGSYDFGILEHQMAMQRQQAMERDQMMMYAAQQAQYQQQANMPRVKLPTKRDVLEYLKQSLNASEVVGVDEFETMKARHICEGGKEILVLEPNSFFVDLGYDFYMKKGYSNLSIEYFLCPKCRKLIYNKGSLSL